MNALPSLRASFLWVSLFAISMGFLESAVVVYLRQLYYPEGFDFPLNLIHESVAITEFLREIATILMLVSVGWIVGRNGAQRFAWFLYSFAIWDIFYYVFLYLLLGWPQSLATWDVLFLVPIMWVGPVWGPVFVALLMILLSSLMLHIDSKGERSWPDSKGWTLLISGSFLVILSWVWEYGAFLLAQYPDQGWTVFLCSPCQQEAGGQFVPQRIYSEIYLPGILLILGGIVRLYLGRKTGPK
ncbi:hypothetical protein KFE98_20350 [bacterium SCSIO 12741]|nr:hypothetical protein KFE98_20350 [bacterium SCSIO 12741]